MDFSILNILVRTQHLPPSDPWLAGAPLGYYTFGQEMVVFLTLLTNLSTRFTFNLAFGMLGGTILQGAFSLARNWGGRLRAGVAGAAFILLLGNLSGLREWLEKKRALDWDYFWATSRVIRDTINEYPLWSLRLRGPPRARPRDPRLPPLRGGGPAPRAPPWRAAGSVLLERPDRRGRAARLHRRRARR